MESSASDPLSPRPLNRHDYKTLILSALGGALEFYDFVIFVFFASVISHLFFPTDMPEWLRLFQTFGVFASGYLARPLGGIIMAHFGDKVGRKRLFVFSILLMSIPSLIMGLLPTYATAGYWAPVLLVLMRVCQGAAIGGEAPGAWVFVTEHVPSTHTSVAGGALSLGFVGGILLGSGVAVACNRSFDETTLLAGAWRIPFVLGGVLGLMTLWLRRYLHETPVFTEMQARKAIDDALPIKRVVRDHRHGIVLSMLVTWVLTAAIVVGLLMMPTLLQGLGVERTTALQANSLAIAMTMVGCLVSGRLGDRIGDALSLAIFSFGLGISFIFFYVGAARGASYLYVSYAAVGFFIGIVGVVPAIIVKSFPAAVRFSGVSFAYNVAYAVFGGLTPMLLSVAIHHSVMAPVYYIIGVSLLGIGTGLYMLLTGRARPVLSR